VRRTYCFNLIIALLALLLTWQAAAPAYAQSGPPVTYEDESDESNEPDIPEAPDASVPPESPMPAFRQTPPYVWLPPMLTETVINSREEGLEMSGVVPVVSEEYGEPSFLINQMLDAAKSNRVRAAKASRAKSISFGYRLHSDHSVISIVLLSTVTSATPKTVVDSVNFNPMTGMITDLTSAAGFDIIPLASKVLRERIRSNPEGYNAGLDISSIAGKPFYIESGQAVILFDEFELTTAAGGANELTLELNRISRVSISDTEYHTDYSYPMKMIPLKKVCEALGYTVDEGGYRVYIRRDGEVISELTPGVNNYIENGRRTRSLEAPPERWYGRAVFVPISFFDQILSWIAYTVENKSITFYSYRE
jgi:hypothetical protein